ncbi:hypothetical protein EON68_03200, partial [archaeon]
MRSTQAALPSSGDSPRPVSGHKRRRCAHAARDSSDGSDSDDAFTLMPSQCSRPSARAVGGECASPHGSARASVASVAGTLCATPTPAQGVDRDAAEQPRAAPERPVSPDATQVAVHTGGSSSMDALNTTAYDLIESRMESGTPPRRPPPGEDVVDLDATFTPSRAAAAAVAVTAATGGGAREAEDAWSAIHSDASSTCSAVFDDLLEEDEPTLVSVHPTLSASDARVHSSAHVHSLIAPGANAPAADAPAADALRQAEPNRGTPPASVAFDSMPPSQGWAQSRVRPTSWPTSGSSVHEVLTQVPGNDDEAAAATQLPVPDSAFIPLPALTTALGRMVQGREGGRRASGADAPSYKYAHPAVRARAAREALRAFPCQECAAFFRNLLDGHADDA